MEYVVGEGDIDRPNGNLPFVCSFLDKAKNVATLGPTVVYDSNL